MAAPDPAVATGDSALSRGARWRVAAPGTGSCRGSDRSAVSGDRPRYRAPFEHGLQSTLFAMRRTARARARRDPAARSYRARRSRRGLPPHAGRRRACRRGARSAGSWSASGTIRRGRARSSAGTDTARASTTDASRGRSSTLAWHLGARPTRCVTSATGSRHREPAGIPAGAHVRRRGTRRDPAADALRVRNGGPGGLDRHLEAGHGRPTAGGAAARRRRRAHAMVRRRRGIAADIRRFLSD
jgi:hypothetical protein